MQCNLRRTRARRPNPPLVLRVAVGGESEASTDWLVTGGLVRGLRLHPPADFEGEIPIHGYAEDDEPVAYCTGRARVVARNVTPVEVWVDLREGGLSASNSTRSTTWTISANRRPHRRA